MVGGQDSVKVRFRWDGDYYYWQVDDISIVNTPPNRLAYTDWQRRASTGHRLWPRASVAHRAWVSQA